MKFLKIIGVFVVAVVSVVGFLAWWGPRQGNDGPGSVDPTATVSAADSAQTATVVGTGVANAAATATPRGVGPTTMTFEVRVPANTPVEDAVYFYSGEHFWRPMQRVDDRTWTISFAVEDLVDQDYVEGGAYHGASYNPGTGELDYAYSRGWGYLGAESLVDYDDVEYWGISRTVPFEPGTTRSEAVERWRWMPPDGTVLQTYEARLTEWLARVAGWEFQAGAMLADLWDDSIAVLSQPTNEAIMRNANATWVQLAPPWDFREMDPLPVISNQDVDVPAYRDEESLRQHIRHVKDSGLKLLLAPQVCCNMPRQDNSEAWKAEWFSQYENFLLYHARIAEEEGADAFLVDWASGHVGTRPGDFEAPVWFEDRWREIIAKVRGEYSGPIGFNSLAGHPVNEWQVPFEWEGMHPIVDLFDFVGMALWAGLAEGGGATQGELTANVAAALDIALEPIDLPVVLTSVAYGSFDGAAKSDLGVYEVALETFFNEQEAHLEWDGIEQAMIFQAVMEYVAAHPQIVGVHPFLYQYLAFPMSSDYSIRGKPAEAVVGAWYELATQ